MSHTPQEAESLWCPMVRIAQVGVSETPATYNRVMIKMHVNAVLRDENGNEQTEFVLKATPSTPIASCCIGDKCAMWRWVPSTTKHKERAIERTPLGASLEVLVDAPDAPTHGFCGLAGGVQP
jgi:hypothetical protein